MNTTTCPCALTRTWNIVTHDCMDGAVVQIRRHTVTLTRTATGIVTEINGQPADTLEAVQILRGAAFRTVTAEVLEVPIIKKAAVSELPRLPRPLNHGCRLAGPPLALASHADSR